jgi:hypothetical protein
MRLSAILIVLTRVETLSEPFHASPIVHVELSSWPSDFQKGVKLPAAPAAESIRQ